MLNEQLFSCLYFNVWNWTFLLISPFLLSMKIPLLVSVCSSCPYPFVFVNLSIFSCVTSHVCRLSLLCCNISSNPFLSKANQKPVMNGITGSISCSFQTFRNLKINLICERNVLFVISQYWLNCYKEMYIECSFIINTILIVILPVELSSISLLP